MSRGPARGKSSPGGIELVRRARDACVELAILSAARRGGGFKIAGDCVVGRFIGVATANCDDSRTTARSRIERIPLSRIKLRDRGAARNFPERPLEKWLAHDVRDVNRDGRPAFALAATDFMVSLADGRIVCLKLLRRADMVARICPRELFAYIRIRLDSKRKPTPRETDREREREREGESLRSAG